MRVIHKNRPMLFEPSAWQVVEQEFREETNKRNETIFALGNGYLGLRGTFEEGFYGSPEQTNPGTFINGIYEYKDYYHLWKRPGFPERTHSILNVTNGCLIGISVDGEEFSLARGKVDDYRRVLDMQTGILSRSLVWTSPGGKKISITMERFLSLDDIHLMTLKCVVTPLNFSGKIVLTSTLDGDVRNANLGKPEIGGVTSPSLFIVDKGTYGGTGFISHTTRISGQFVAAAMVHHIGPTEIPATQETIPDEKKVIHRFCFRAESNKPVTLEKFVNYQSSRDVAREECLQIAVQEAESARDKGYEALRSTHIQRWQEFWEDSDVVIKGEPALQQAVRFSIYHIMQSTGKDGKTNISANGLTGEGYQGHTFWDSEVYIIPLFIYTQPWVARQMLMYRYNILDNARERARQMDDQGALFSWNSINGEECGFVFEAATAQYHINCDICYAIYKYWEATGDEEFLVNYGAEILFETSKCMAHRGSFIKYRADKFCINVVCGPDEYTPAVDNNCYTNSLTRFQLYFALQTAELLRTKYPEKYRDLVAKVGLDQLEFDLWQRAVDNMYIPYNEELGILLQDDAFLYRDPIDVDSIPQEKLPLLLTLHPLNLWRYQVAKQADTVLLTFLLSHQYSQELKKAIYDFYEPRTIHDSSLSASIHSIVANDIGYKEEALGYFLQAARMDLDDYNRNTHQGIHAACMGATWMVVVNGFAGMRVYDGKLHFAPYLPPQWEGLEFRVKFQGRVVKVVISQKQAVYELLQGEVLEINHGDESIRLEKGTARAVNIGEVNG